MEIPDEGRLDAPLVLIGECGGRDEERLGRPFVGPSGKALAKWWRTFGLERSQFYITNVVPFRPRPTGKIAQLSKEDLEAWGGDLHWRLGQLKDPRIIVPVGADALKALLGYDSITKHRGSPYAYKDNQGREVLVIASYHPAFTFRDPGAERACIADWAKIKRALTEGLSYRDRQFITRPTEEDLEWYCEQVGDEAVLSIDIETPRRAEWVAGRVLKSGKVGKPKRVLGDPYISCVGFSHHPDFAISIPTTEEYWGSHSKAKYALDCVRYLCEGPCPKVLQNGGFDTWWLEREHQIKVVNYRWDLKAMHHCADPCDEHNLAYMASIDTNEPYWKDEAKDPDEASKYANDFEAFATYNCLDAAVQRELWEVYAKRLERMKLGAVYARDYRALFEPNLRVSLHGVRVDAEMRKGLAEQYAMKSAALRDKIALLAGMELYGTKALSVKKLKQYLYDSLRLPQQYAKNSKGEMSVTTREVAVRRLMRRYPEKLDAVGALILDQRRVQQLSTFVAESRVDDDGRIRCSYGFSPETGRLSCTRAPNRKGANLQNQDREIRQMFVPDEGCVFVEVDYSQGESRIVSAYSKDAGAVERARSLPGEYDEHRETAALVFGVPEGEVGEAQRYIGKRINHAKNYGMHGKKLSEELSKEGYTYEADEMEEFLEMVHAKHPYIRDWHRRIRMEIMRHRSLTNAFGTTIRFPFERLDDALYRRGYAFKPQSDLAKLMNIWGYVPLSNWIELEQVPAKINVQGHDSLLISVEPSWAYEVLEFCWKSMHQEVSYDGVALTVPLEAKLGLRWGQGMKFVRMPSRAQFDLAYGEVVSASRAA